MFKKIIFLLGLTVLSFFIVSCQQETKITSILINPNDIDSPFLIDDFSIEDLKLEVRMSNGEVIYVPITKSMLSIQDQEKLLEVGNHYISVTYEGFLTTFLITLTYNELTTQLRIIYDLAVQAQATTLTYEEWIASIKGEDGREVELRVNEQFIQWRFLGESNWTDLISLESLRGPSGKSAYEVFIFYYPDYPGDEQQWIIDLSLGLLGSYINGSKPEYTVIFNSMGGSLVTAVTVEEGSVITQPAAPTREGYVFKGWFTDSAYNAPYSFASQIGANLTLYAKWAQLFTVTFNSNGGTAVASVQTEQGLTLSQPSDPTREGFVFDGWYTSTALTTKYNFSTPVTSNLTLVAGWIEVAPIQFVVSFNSSGGSYVAPRVVTDGTAVEAPEAPTRVGFTFVRWTLNGNAYDFATPVTSNITLTAEWEAIPQFTVRFEHQDGTLIENVQVYQGDKVVAPTPPSRLGYSFAGWSVQVGTELVSFNFDTPITAATTIIAVYILIPVSEGTYYTSVGSVNNLNPYSETSTNASELYTLMSDYLYRGDYDWDLAIDLGLATQKGDFTNTANLPFTYVPSMAAELPLDVNGNGRVWEIKLRDDLEFVDGTVIDANTFDYSWKQLLDPKLLNARATNLYSPDSLPLVNAEAYFKQLTPDKDELGFIMYMVGSVQYARANSYFGKTVYGYDIYHVENKYATLVGPGGTKAYVEDWGDTAYGLNGWVLETQADTYFRIGTDNNLYAPTTGWTLNGVAVPAVTELPEGVTIKSGGAGYAGALPAYMDAQRNRATVDENGLPVGGVTTLNQSTPVEWSEVGFEVIDNLIFRITLTQKKSQWQVMTNLASAITSVVHPTNFENGKIEGGARTTYGTHANPLISFGRYELIEWQPDTFFRFQRNDDHYDAAAYRLKFIRYDIISDQSVAINEFRAGRLDVSVVSGLNYQLYKDSPYLKLTPVTTFFRFAFSLDRMNDGDPSNDTAIMKYPDFRKALYYATDRETFVTDVRAPGYPTHGLLGPAYFSSEQNPFSYRASTAGQGVLADFAPETSGYNPVLAKQLFDQAYAQAVADGAIEAESIVSIEFVFSDADVNHTMANWLKGTWEAIFGPKFNLVKNAVPGTQLTATGTGIWDTGNFDLTFGGWQGLQFNAPGMLQVYSSGRGAAYMLEVGFETGSAELSVNLQYGKVAVQGWLSDLLSLPSPTASEQSYIILFQDFLADFEGDIYTNTYDYLWDTVYYQILYYDIYDGRDVDFDYITAALESELLAQMINIPLFSITQAFIYSSRVRFDAQAYHARMGWGGYRYMYLVNV